MHYWDDIQAELYFDKKPITTLVTGGKDGLTHITFDGESLQETNYKPFMLSVQVRQTAKVLSLGSTNSLITMSADGHK